MDAASLATAHVPPKHRYKQFVCPVHPLVQANKTENHREIGESKNVKTPGNFSVVHRQSTGTNSLYALYNPLRSGQCRRRRTRNKCRAVVRPRLGGIAHKNVPSVHICGMDRRKARCDQHANRALRRLVTTSGSRTGGAGTANPASNEEYLDARSLTHENDAIRYTYL
jgi:hypothetical protein